MARPNKTGLDYFSFDVDFFNDEKIEAISGEFGIKGEIATIKLLCTIYRNGYFTIWNELTKMKLLKSLPGVSIELLEQIVLRLVKWNFFNENLFNSDKVLTSNGIQKRYLEATKRRKDDIQLVYVCNNEVNVNINHATSVLNVDINAQSKVKESKVKESKVNDIKERKLKFASTLEPFFEKFGKDLCRDFYKYWTEPNKSNTKFRQELERTWDVERRLETWQNNDFKNKNFNNGSNSTNFAKNGINNGKPSKQDGVNELLAHLKKGIAEHGLNTI